MSRVAKTDEAYKELCEKPEQNGFGCGGIWFQILGPQTEKARFPNCVRVLTTKAALVIEERSWRRPDSAVLNELHDVAEITYFSNIVQFVASSVPL